MLRAPLQSSFALQPLKVSTHHARLYMVCAPMQSLCNPKQESLCLSFATLAVPYYLAHLCSLRLLHQPQESPPCHTTLCSLYSSRKALQSSYEQKRKSLCLLFCACSLHRYKIPMQSPHIAPTLKVPPHHARLSVSFCSVYLCGLGVTFAPLCLALTIGERAVSGSI